MSTPENREQWQQMADSLSINGQAFIDGEYCAAASSDTFDCISPVDGKVLVKVASCNEADANIAVANAREVFDRGDWSQMPPVKRKQVMIRFAELLEANMDELALLETLDMGKPIRYSRTVDVAGRRERSAGQGKLSIRFMTRLHPRLIMRLA